MAGSVIKALAEAVGGNMTAEKMGEIMNDSGLQYTKEKGWQAVTREAIYDRPALSMADIYKYIGLDITAAELQSGADTNSISGKYSGEPNRDILFEMITGLAKQQNLMGKLYSADQENIYVCSTFVEDLLYMIGFSRNEFLPGGGLVKASIDRIKDIAISPGEGVNPGAGTYIFYKLFDDNASGHTGIVSFGVDGSTTILHNGNDKNENQNVNIRDYSLNFDSWFKGNAKNPVIYQKLIPR
jgi:hypothetical protein